MRVFSAVLIFALLCSGLAQGKEFSGVQVTDRVISGNGCPDGAESSQGYDFLLGIIGIFEDKFDGFYAETGRRSLVRKSCSIATAVKVDAGYQVGFSPRFFRGSVSVAPEGRASFKAKFFFAGQSDSIDVEKSWKGEEEEQFNIFTNENEELPLLWSKCGEDTIIRSNISIIARAPRGAGASTFIEVDSHSYIYFPSENLSKAGLKVRKCND